MRTIHKVNQVADRRWFVYFEGLTQLGESVTVEITGIDNNRHPGVEKWYLQVYATDAENNCRGRYNPTVMKGGYGFVYDPDWAELDATRGNAERLLCEVSRLAFGE